MRDDRSASFDYGLRPSAQDAPLHFQIPWRGTRHEKLLARAIAASSPPSWVSESYACYLFFSIRMATNFLLGNSTRTSPLAASAKRSTVIFHASMMSIR